MKTKNKIGALIMLGGIAFIGLYWFKKNKPTNATKQSKELDALTNLYKTGGDETYIKGIEPPTYFQLSLFNPNDLKDMDGTIFCDGDGSLAKTFKFDCTEFCKKNPLKCAGFK